MIHPHKPNLAEAQAALAKLLPHLPCPRLSEYMSCCGVALPKICDDKNLVFLEQPETLISSLGPFVFRKLPKQWLPAYYHHRKRLARNAQLIRLLPLCQAGELAGHVENHEYAPDGHHRPPVPERIQNRKGRPMTHEPFWDLAGRTLCLGHDVSTTIEGLLRLQNTADFRRPITLYIYGSPTLPAPLPTDAMLVSCGRRSALR